MKRIGLILMTIILVALPMFSQNVNIPNANFLAALIEKGIDTNEDGLISTTEAEVATYLDVSAKNISDMTGIESFINLDTLVCHNNQLTSLDVSNNIALESLICFTNRLTSLDVSNNIKLSKLDCGINQLTSLDVSKNMALTSLSFVANQLTSIDVSNNTALTSLHCRANQLTNLDFSNNVALTLLNCYANQITSLNVSNNIALKRLFCFGNQLTSLDVSNCTALEELDCFENQLTSLDVSNNSALWELGVSDNQLTSLDVSNNTGLLELWVSNNQFSSIDISNNSSLVSLFCSENQLTSLDVSNCIDLLELYCSDNQLTSLDVSNNAAIEYLYLSNMPTLYQVCVWELPFPPISVNLDTTGSPNVYFTTECSDNIAPNILAADNLYQPVYIAATSSEDGMIYLVPENTEKDIGIIRGVSIDSVEAVANSPINISISSLDNGKFWLYARDSTGNISEPKAFTIMGVGVDYKKAENVRIYPNPTDGILTINTENPNNTSIEITSLNGQKILIGEMEGTSHQLDLSPFQKGVYFITIRSKDFVTIKKIIKL
ncbi:MAG: T9SS type A sorting domain-containing protein [Bacteroidetes bacterium]|nr:T9SS type A sorting domain-containing protein [Bacteroidota bacterium]